MINLATADRQRLVRMLADLPELGTEAMRRQLLELAGLEPLVPLLDLSGPPLSAVANIVSRLSRYGRVGSGSEALGLLLNLVREIAGEEKREQFDALLLRYEMMTPAAARSLPDPWRGTDTSGLVNERIIGENSLRPMAFLAEALRVARSVAYIEVATANLRWSGTGFLIAPDLLITNNHVLPGRDLLARAVVRLNYENSFVGEALPAREYSFAVDRIFHTNPGLDYTIAHVDGAPGREWGWIPLVARTARVGERLNIIQHPGGQPKQIAMQNNFVEYVGGDVVQYVTSTLPGSSGSPVLNDRWEAVAVHRAGGNVREPTTGRVYFRNEGVLVASVVSDLPADLKAILS